MVPNYIRPLDKDVDAVFDPARNKASLRHGICKRWLLKDNNGKLIGRIRIVNKNTRTKEMMEL